MTPEEESYLNTRGVFAQVAQLLTLNKIALITAFLRQRFPGIPFVVQLIPPQQVTVMDHAPTGIRVSFPTSQSAWDAQQALASYFLQLNDTGIKEILCRSTDSLAL